MFIIILCGFVPVRRVYAVTLLDHRPLTIFLNERLIAQYENVSSFCYNVPVLTVSLASKQTCSHCEWVQLDAYVKTSNAITSSCFAGNIRDFKIQRRDGNENVKRTQV